MLLSYLSELPLCHGELVEARGDGEPSLDRLRMLRDIQNAACAMAYLTPALAFSRSLLFPLAV